MNLTSHSSNGGSLENTSHIPFNGARGLYCNFKMATETRGSVCVHWNLNFLSVNSLNCIALHASLRLGIYKDKEKGVEEGYTG